MSFGSTSRRWSASFSTTSSPAPAPPLPPPSSPTSRPHSPKPSAPSTRSPAACASGPAPPTATSSTTSPATASPSPSPCTTSTSTSWPWTGRGRSPRSHSSCRLSRTAARCSPCKPPCCAAAAASPSAWPCITPPATGRAPRVSSTPGRRPAPAPSRRRPQSSTELSSRTQAVFATPSLEPWRAPRRRMTSRWPAISSSTTFTLSMENIQRIKDVVRLAAAGKGGAPPRCSSLVATFGFIWSCHQRAKHDDAASNGGGGDSTYFIFPVDHRSRMEPDPIPDEYLGNCVGAALNAAPKDRLATAGAVGLFTACTAVAAAIEQAVRVGSIRSPELWWERVREAILSGDGVLAVAGSPRFRVYGVDFGFGQLAKVDIVSVARTGAMAVAESRRSSGGIEVGISLPSDAMRRFQCCFHDAIAWLQCTTPLNK
uniref:Anthocyanin 5-aromatic acyltransferase n=1 Tax=Triticum urartu TaxID=4572 RepID=A0A8R7Q7N0_TRIUA